MLYLKEDMAILQNISFGILIGFVIGAFSGEPLEAKVLKPSPKKPSSITSSIATKLRELPQKIDTRSLNDFLTGTGEAFSEIQESVQWFKKLRQELKRKNVKPMDNVEKSQLLDEMKICKPTNGGKCYSRCKISSGTSYLWCHTTSNLDSWSICGCTLRPEIIDYLQLARNQMLKPQPKPTLSEVEIGLTVTLIVMAILINVMIFGMTFYFKKQRRNQLLNVGQHGLFIQNPVYQPPNNNE